MGRVYVVVTVKLPVELYRKLKEKLVKSDYTTQSELIRDLIKKWINGEID